MLLSIRHVGTATLLLALGLGVSGLMVSRGTAATNGDVKFTGDAKLMPRQDVGAVQQSTPSQDKYNPGQQSEKGKANFNPGQQSSKGKPNPGLRSKPSKKRPNPSQQTELSKAKPHAGPKDDRGRPEPSQQSPSK